MFMPARIKDCYLVYLIRTFLSEPTPAPPALPEQIIVFVSTCNTAQLLSEMMRLLDVPSAPLHSRIPQVHRNNSLRRFKGRIVRVLIATDVASRGLDIPAVGIVINYDVPGGARDYIHRARSFLFLLPVECKCNGPSRWGEQLVQGVQEQPLP